MATQWLRFCRLFVETSAGSKTAIDLSEFRIKFNISQSVARKPSTAEITVYNVGANTVNSILLPLNSVTNSNRPRVILLAGYNSEHGQIFQGDLWWKTVGRESQTDTYMKLVASNGDRACQYGVVNLSLPAGATQKDIFGKAKEALAENGIEVHSTPELMTNALPRGKVIYQNLRDLLCKIADSNNFEFGFTDDGLETVPTDGSKRDTDEVIVLNANTGLIGRPVITPDGIEVRALLNSRLRVGALIQIDNASITHATASTLAGAQNNESDDSYIDADGLYRIISREHIGDNRGNEWYTVMKCEGVNASMKPITPTVAQLGVN